MLAAGEHKRFKQAALWFAIGAFTLVGLILRLLAARGALWLDEAWSATFAQEVTTPLGVIWQINHDNNHILNTLWLQLLGPDASPMAQRALAITTGTAAIPLAAAFCWRRGAWAALIAAFFFAFSPILVTYGSEARGYAPMLAAALASLVLVDGWLERGTMRPVITLAILALLGTLAQVMMLAPLLALTGWAGISLWQRNSFRVAFLEVTRTLGPALAMAALVIAVMALAAYYAPNGFTIGAYTPFSIDDWLHGIDGVTRASLALPHAVPFAALIGLICGAGLVWLRRRDPRIILYVILIFALPLAYFTLRIGNVGIARYYLPAALALLLLGADALGNAQRRVSPIAGTLILLFAVGAVRLDMQLLSDHRADPSAAVAAMKRLAPDGATLILPDKRMTPVFSLAARNADYALTIVGTRCAPAPFLLLDEGQPASLHLCCGVYRLVAARTTHGLSGTNWRLYRRIAA